MNLFYNIGILLTTLGLRFVGVFNEKIRLGVKGRSQTFSFLEKNISASDKTLWFHCASLGEYEQGLPVFEKLRQYYSDHKIILSFFSPSGYEIRKQNPIADHVVYLPLDSKANAHRFVSIVHPELTVFVKYDIWPNYLKTLAKTKGRAILISAAFRPNQVYFKPYGKLFKDALFSFEHIFTQNQASKTLLESIGYLQTSVSGDTRYDRVLNQLKLDNRLPFIEEFKSDNLCVVVGSSWPEDEVLFVNFINDNRVKDIKFIVAPHNIKSAQIKSFVSKLNTEAVLYSEKEGKVLGQYNVLIIDTIGLLSKIYNYADIAYVGGAMGHTGLHNTLEPAVFGVPIIIGCNHDKFPEAKALIANGGMFSIGHQQDFDAILKKLLINSDLRSKAGSKNLEFIEKNSGAVIQILNYLRILDTFH